jgi:hypothetical protein
MSVLLAVIDTISRCIEALTRAGQYDPPLLQQAVKMFEVRFPIKARIARCLRFDQDFLLFSNHVGLYTEEISVAGEGCVLPCSCWYLHLLMHLIDWGTQCKALVWFN